MSLKALSLFRISLSQSPLSLSLSSSSPPYPLSPSPRRSLSGCPEKVARLVKTAHKMCQNVPEIVVHRKRNTQEDQVFTDFVLRAGGSTCHTLSHSPTLLSPQPPCQVVHLNFERGSKNNRDIRLSSQESRSAPELLRKTHAQAHAQPQAQTQAQAGADTDTYTDTHMQKRAHARIHPLSVVEPASNGSAVTKRWKGGGSRAIRELF